MYSASTDKQTPPPDTGKFIRLAIIAIIGVVIFTMVGNQAVILSMNFTEFGEQFTKPLYYTLLSTLILSFEFLPVGGFFVVVPIVAVPLCFCFECLLTFFQRLQV